MTQPLLIEPGSCHDRRSPIERLTLATLVSAEFETERLRETLDAAGETLPERHFHGALSAPLQELLERDGKNFRSRMLQVAYELSAGGSEPAPPYVSLIVEALHAGSLIVDDIEDGSPRRRGGPSLHVMVGLPLALNAGNWLYFLPHRLLEELDLAPERELESRRAIDRAVLRCHYGQALDLGVRIGSLAQREVHGLVNLSTRLKTGSLLELAAELGSITGGASAELRHELAVFARSYGVALQMLDDWSGVQRVERSQKGREDLVSGRPTWPWAWLATRLDPLNYARFARRSEAVVERELAPELLLADVRRALGDEPRREVREHLKRAMHRLSRHVGHRERLQPLLDEMERLEAAYG